MTLIIQGTADDIADVFETWLDEADIDGKFSLF